MPQIEKKNSNDFYETEKQLVVDFLKRYPNFFKNEPDLLTELELSHSVGAKQLSLIDEQLAVLKEKNFKLNNQIKSIKEVFAYNSKLNIKLWDIISCFVHIEEPKQAIDHIIQQIENKLEIKHIAVFSWEIPKQPINNLRQLGLQEHWMQALKETIISNKVLCGEIEKDWQVGIFKKAIASVCIIPLGVNKPWGAIILGSEDKRFKSTYSTQLLTKLGKIFSLKLQGAFKSH